VKTCKCRCHKHGPGVTACSLCGVRNGRHMPNFLARHTSVLLSYVGRRFSVREVAKWTDTQRDDANLWVAKCLSVRPDPPEFLKLGNCTLVTE